MTNRHNIEELLVRDEVVAAPSLRSEGCTDRTFEIPTGIFATMFALFFGFLAVMTLGFAADGLAVPMAVNFFFVAMFVAVPAIWARMTPAKRSRALSLDRFWHSGVATLTGRCGAGAAATQMLLLPALTLFWAVAVTTLYALV